jgi:multidrug efflux pump subunit AcrB
MSGTLPDKTVKDGLIGWMAKNSVAANILMLSLIVGGIVVAFNIKQETFPSFLLDIVDVSVSYPGASPEEVEDGIIIPIEEEIRTLEVIDRMVSKASEGSAKMSIELVEGVDPNRALQDIKNGIDRISFFPEDAERPVIGLNQKLSRVVDLVVYGPLNENEHFELTEKIRNDLLQFPDISQVDVRFSRNPEIHIEIPQLVLRSLGLTLDEVAGIVRESARDLPAGGVKTEGGEILLRTSERRDFASEYGDIVVVSNADGTKLRLRDIAVIRDGFVDRNIKNTWNGGRATFIRISSIGDQKPLDIADEVYAYIDELNASLPEGIEIGIFNDSSKEYRERINLLIRNGTMGLVLVLLMLGLFLRPRLAFWVAAGIATTMVGSLVLLPLLGASINMISLFAFIVSLGIVVDDAVIVGENVFYKLRKGVPPLEAAVEGTKEMLVPVILAVLTNIIAFTPLLFVPGETGRFMENLPAVIIVSLFEALFILPAHLAHAGRDDEKGTGALSWLTRKQTAIALWLDWFIEERFGPFLKSSVGNKYMTLAVSAAFLLLTWAYYASGRVNFSFNPVITGKRVDAEIELPYGSPFSETVRIADHIEQAGLRAADRFGGKDKVLEGRMNVVGRLGENWSDVNFILVSPNERDFTEEEFLRAWREEVGEVAGIESLYFEYNEGPGSGAGLVIELSHPDTKTLESAAAELAAVLRTYAGVTDINDGIAEGKPQIDFELTPQGRSLGITPEFIGRRLRNAFYGSEALRFQRGRYETKVMVRLPEDERRSLANVEDLIIRTPSGGEIPLTQAAKLTYGRSFIEINRVGGSRVVNVEANTIPEVVNINKIRLELLGSVLPGLTSEYPGLSYSFEGRTREQRRAMHELMYGFAIAVVAIFAIFAVVFRSYTESLIIMTSIPFAAAAAFLGHAFLGYELSVVSIFGMIALCGLVVNGGLVLNHAINKSARDGKLPIEEAVIEGTKRRFRPLMLTSLTTFIGLVPIIFETSPQAKFLVPMAISLGFGVLVSSVAIMFVVPALRLVAIDVRALFAGSSAKKQTQ